MAQGTVLRTAAVALGAPAGVSGSYACAWTPWAPGATSSNPLTRHWTDRRGRYGACPTDTRWRRGTTQPEDYGPPPAYAWAGTNEAPDHLHPNVAYRRAFDLMMRALFDQGLTAHIHVKVYNKHVTWPERRSLADDLYFKLGI